MYKVTILPVAKQDIKEAAEWYNSKQTGLGKRFTNQVREKVNLVKQNPYSSANRYEEVRTAVMDVFPFMIHYLIDASNKLVCITAVLHTSRNPDRWKADREGTF